MGIARAQTQSYDLFAFSHTRRQARHDVLDQVVGMFEGRPKRRRKAVADAELRRAAPG